MKKFTHLNKKGELHMVDISKKGETLREAWVTGEIRASKEICQKIKDNYDSQRRCNCHG